MKKTTVTMGMPATVIIAETLVKKTDIEAVFQLWRQIDERFSPFKPASELERLNRGDVTRANLSQSMQEILTLADQTKTETDGYFDISHNGRLDPSGIVKGWAINQGARLLRQKGYRNFYLEISGDIALSGHNTRDQRWRIGIRNPFLPSQITTVVELTNAGIATSGCYFQGNHIYNPNIVNGRPNNIVSLTVIGPDVYEADRFATAAFAMGEIGLDFLEKLDGFEAHLTTNDELTFTTSGFHRYVSPLVITHA